MTPNKDSWLIWDVNESMWWKRVGEYDYDLTDSRIDAARLGIAEALTLIEAVNDPANDPAAAIVPDFQK